MSYVLVDSIIWRETTDFVTIPRSFFHPTHSFNVTGQERSYLFVSASTIQTPIDELPTPVQMGGLMGPVSTYHSEIFETSSSGSQLFCELELQMSCGPTVDMHDGGLTFNLQHEADRTFMLLVLQPYVGFAQGGSVTSHTGDELVLLSDNAFLDMTQFVFIATRANGGTYAGPGVIEAEYNDATGTRLMVIQVGDFAGGQFIPTIFTGITPVGPQYAGATWIGFGDPSSIPPGSIENRIPCPPLRHRQRDDDWETPRMKVGPQKSHPTSASELDRRGHVNTYDGPRPCFDSGGCD